MSLKVFSVNNIFINFYQLQAYNNKDTICNVSSTESENKHECVYESSPAINVQRFPFLSFDTKKI